MKRAIAIFLLFLLIFLLSGCNTDLDAGTVVSKQFVSSHKVYQPMVMIINKHPMIIPRWINVPDKWFVTIQSEERSDTWLVSEDYYRQVEIGDYIERGVSR